MILKFYAREDALVRYPGLTPRAGQPARYVGRDFIAGETAPIPGTDKRQTMKPASNPAKPQPDEFDSESAEGQALMRHCRKNGLWAADKDTAAACGVEFVPVELVDGMWVQKKSKPESPAKTVGDR